MLVAAGTVIRITRAGKRPRQGFLYPRCAWYPAPFKMTADISAGNTTSLPASARAWLHRRTLRRRHPRPYRHLTFPGLRPVMSSNRASGFAVQESLNNVPFTQKTLTRSARLQACPARTEIEKVGCPLSRKGLKVVDLIGMPARRSEVVSEIQTVMSLHATNQIPCIERSRQPIRKGKETGEAWAP